MGNAAQGSKKHSFSRKESGSWPLQIGLAMAQYNMLREVGEAEREDMENMLAGIKKYQDHPYVREHMEHGVVWQDGEVKLLHLPAKRNPEKNNKGALLLIPSLINKSYIMDLLPDNSFMSWLSQNGFDVYLVDWGSPADDGAMENFEDLLHKKLLPAIKVAAERAGDKIHALGYCMGGTILAAAAQIDRSNLKTATFLASPWDFHAGDQILATQIGIGTPSALHVLAAANRLPQDWIQSVFVAVNAEYSMQKFGGFSQMKDDDPKAELFVAVEDWLNDGIDMPGDLARTCILDWYRDNHTGKGQWKVGDVAIDLHGIDIPVLVIASAKDRLVPEESSVAVAEIIKGAEVMRPTLGHIGMITSRKAEKEVWQPLAKWLEAH